MKLKLSLFLFIIYMHASMWAQQKTHTFIASGPLYVPAGITTMNAHAWGAGGAGGAATEPVFLTGRGGAGGGGGAYAAAAITVIPGTSINTLVALQTAGTSGSGASGGHSTITNYEAIISAAGGSGGIANTAGGAPAGGLGGSIAGSTGTTKTAGLIGTVGATGILAILISGAGGTAANTAGGGGIGGAGIASALGAVNKPGNPGIAAGGGGGGGIHTNSGATNIENGGAGARGLVILDYICTQYSLLTTVAANICITSGTTSVHLTGAAANLPVGTYTVTYSRSNPPAAGLSANMTVTSAGTASFDATGLTNVGTSTITVTNLASGDCTYPVTANNASTLTVSPLTVHGAVNGGTTICSGSTSTALTLTGQTGSVVKWQYSINPFSTWNDITNTATTYTSGPLTATTQFRAVVQSGTCISADSDFTTVTVNPLPTITLGTVTPVCTNVSTHNITLPYTATANTPTTYSIVWNASPTNSFATVINAALTGSPITIGVPAGTAPGTYIGTITVRNANTCTSNPGVNFNVVINPLPTAPVIGTITHPTCLIPTGSISLSGLPAGGTLTRYPGAIAEPYSGTAVTISGLSANTYTFTTNNGTCTSLLSSNAVVPGLVTNTYTTSWSNGTPTLDQNIVFAGDFVTAGGGAGNINACSCTVNPGVTVTVQFLDTLALVNSLTNNGGTVNFQNNSSFIQSTNAVNTGNISYKRTSPQITLTDFTYWSTPVSPQRLIDVSPLSSSDKFYGYNGTTWVPNNSTSNMTVGKGYIIRAPNNYSNTVKTDYTASFVGVPNNGDLFGETVTGNDQFYLVGNPYPSALEANTFIIANTFLNGTLYFWTHNTPVVLVGAYKYSSDDYASYNLTGGVGIGKSALSGTLQNNNRTPNGKIAAGQSFFVSANGAGTIAFTNAMRSGGVNNSHFFKSANTSNAIVEKHRVWLSMTNDGGAFKQILVGYVEGASNNDENGYDGKTFDGNRYLDFYSINNDNKYVIQGRALPFIETDTVELGYRSTITGDFTISIDHADGDLINHSIYLEDKTANMIHDLQASSYTFSTSTGTFTNRFVLRYTNKTLGTGDFEQDSENVMVVVQNKVITITSDAEKIDTVYIYDLSGKMIYKETNLSDNIVRIDNLKVQNQVLLVKVILDTNESKIYKIVY